MSVQFSELHSVKGRLLWSPSGELLATTEGNQLMIRSGDSLQIIGVHSCVDLIDKIQWSSNSEYILCLMRKRGLIMVWSISDIKWEAKIEEGLAGLTNAFWSPDNKHIITVSEFEIRLTIWSLIDGTAKYIKYPKNNHLGIKFSKNGKYLAVAERTNHMDILGIYSVKYWQLIQRFNIDGMSDLWDIRWSHNDQYILCINNELLYKFVIYTPRGRKVFEYSAYDNALGIRCVDWSKNNKYLCVGSYDNKVRIFNTMTWRIVSEFKCDESVNHQINEQYKTKSTICYQEISIPHDSNQENEENEDQQNEEMYQEKTRYALKNIRDMELSVTKKKKNAKQQNKKVNDHSPAIGVNKCEWSHNSRFCAVVSESMDNVVWIWDMKYLVFHSILSHRESVKSIAWNNINNKLQLAISCNNDRLYLWSKSGAVVIRVVASRFAVKKISWRPITNVVKHPSSVRKRSKYHNIISKDCICLIDRNHFCCCYDLDF